MNIFVEHDAAAVSQMIGISRPACDGIIVRHGQPDEVLAASIRANPLTDSWLLDTELPGGRVVAWSGTLGDELFESHPMTWMAPGHTALAQFCDEIEPQLKRHEWRLCFQPHACHVLSDVQSCVNFLAKRKEGPFEIVLSPASMLTPAMLPMAEDHLTRMFEMLGARAAMVFMSDVKLVEEDGEQAIRPVPLGEGVLPREVVRRLVAKHVPGDTPVVIGPRQIAAQLEWLGE